MNQILRNINKKGWLLMFSWQLPNGEIYMVFRRIREPQFVVSVSGGDGRDLYSDAEIKIAWLEDFVEREQLDGKWDEFEKYMNKKIKFIKNKFTE